MPWPIRRKCATNLIKRDTGKRREKALRTDPECCAEKLIRRDIGIRRENELRADSDCGAENLTGRDIGIRREKALRTDPECCEENLIGRDTGSWAPRKVIGISCEKLNVTLRGIKHSEEDRCTRHPYIQPSIIVRYGSVYLWNSFRSHAHLTECTAPDLPISKAPAGDCRAGARASEGCSGWRSLRASPRAGRCTF
jgi:hypothetical protein